MIHIYDREMMALALASDLDPKLKSLLTARIEALDAELIDQTEYLIVQPHDTEHDIIRHIGFSPLVEPIDGTRFGTAGFSPCWDWLADCHGWFEMIVTFGSTFAYVLFIADRLDALGNLCRQFSVS